MGNSAALNQIGYLLIVGVLIDCFVTTKLIIPCAMALLPYDLNFWPRKRGAARATELSVQPLEVATGSGTAPSSTRLPERSDVSD